MHTVYPSCCGLDVHKKSVMACVSRVDNDGKMRKHIRQFGTVTRELLKLGDWLSSFGVTHVAMESTGVFWRPIYNLLDGRFELLLVNAQHIKQVPGRKTDVKDCEWIADLLQHGLLKASFVPSRPLQELRDLTRHRAQLTQEKGREVNRIHKTLEGANIKLGAVATDIMGVSGRSMIESIIHGRENVDKLAELARGRLRNKIPELRLALEGQVSKHHRFMLKTHYEHIVYIEGLIDSMSERIEELMASEETSATGASEQDSKDQLSFSQAVSIVKQAPGLETLSAQAIVAEIGTDMSRFPTHNHLASWAGVCPGNNESAGKRKSGKTTKGSKWLRRVLNQVAWAASRKKNSYFSAQYRRLAARRGKKRAAVAVAHSILTVIYHMLKTRKPYEELGPNFFLSLDPERMKRYFVKRLESLGQEVTLKPSGTTA